jgi:hypothetical protein
VAGPSPATTWTKCHAPPLKFASTPQARAHPVPLRVPSAPPSSMAGLRISSGLALIGAVEAEFVTRVALDRLLLGHWQDSAVKTER